MKEFIPEMMMQDAPESYPASLSTEEIRYRFLRLLGPFEHPSVPLNPSITEEIILSGDIIRQRVEYDVDTKERIAAFHLFHKDIPSNAPGILAIHPHGAGEDFAKGKNMVCNDDAEKTSNYAYHAALHGFRVLAPDALCFGDRVSSYGYEKELMSEINAHMRLCACGKSLAWKTVWDNSRALEMLEFLGAEKLGAMGHSGGSTQAYILASANQKVKATVCFASFLLLRRQFWQYRIWHCLYHYIPNMILTGIDWDQVVTLIPPRKIFLAFGTRDEGTPAVMPYAFHDAISKVSSDCSELLEEDVGHEITRTALKGGLDFLERNL